MAQVFQNFINGAWVSTKSGQTAQSTNPADLKDVVGEFQKSTAEDAQVAIASANAAKERWAGASGLARGQFLLKAAAYLEKNAEEYAQAITREAGKAILESRGEVGRAVGAGELGDAKVQ